MRKLLKNGLLLALMPLMLVSCGSNDGQNTSDVADLNDGKTRIALLINGDLGDMSFNDSANNGMLKFQEDHKDCYVKIIEMGGSDPSKWESTLTQTANEAYDLIICGTTEMREPLQRLVKKEKYSDRRFIIFDTEIKDNAASDFKTVHSMMFSQNEGGYIAGVVANLLTKELGATKTAFVGGGKNDIINDFGYGFMQGVKSVNEDKGYKVYSYNSYIGDFTNSPKGKSIADSFYTSGVEVLFAAASQAGLGCIDSAKNNDKYIIGVDSDQYAYYENSDAKKASRIVSSVLKRVDLALYEACEKFINNTLEYGTLDVLGVDDGKIGLVENANYKSILNAEDQKYVANVIQNINDKKITIKSGLKRYTSSSEINALYDELDPNKQ